MSQTALPTNAGRAWNARAFAGQDVSPITEIAFGDGDYTAFGGETALQNEVHRTALEGEGVLADQTGAWFDGRLPSGVGGFVIREVGLFTADGEMVAIGTRDPALAVQNQDDFTYRFEVFFDHLDALVVEVAPVHGLTTENVLENIPALPIDRQLRPDFRSVEAFANDPPVAPDAGETWIVGAAPTGAFVGHEDELAEWSGTGWTFAAPTPWMHVGLADRTDWRWDHTLDPMAWVLWEGTETIAGPVRLEPVPPDPASTDTALTPAGAQALRTEAPPSGYLRIDGKPAQAIANNVHTLLSWNAPTADTDNAWSAAGYTCPRAGILFVRANATIERAADAILTGLLQIHVNGAMHQTGPYRDTDSSAAPGVVRYLNALVVDAVVVGVGDVVTITAFQQSNDGGGADINTSWNETSLTMFYVGGPFA